MYRTTDERIAFLEKEMNRQAFQIQLLYAILQNKEKAGIYELIIQMKLSEHSFIALKKCTSYYEDQLKDGFAPTLSSFIQDVQGIFEDHSELVTFNDLSHFIPRWLGGVNGSPGFSPLLHKHFYQ